MRNSETPIHYLVGSPRGRLTQLEKAFLTKPWEDVRASVRVKLIEHGKRHMFSPAAKAGATRSNRCGGGG